MSLYYTVQWEGSTLGPDYVFKSLCLRVAVKRTAYASVIKSGVCYQDKTTHSVTIVTSIFYQVERTAVYPGAPYHSGAFSKPSSLAKIS